MVHCMKTTIDIAVQLLQEAKGVAARERTTLRALVEEGLRKVLQERRPRRGRFKLRDASFAGRGLQRGIAEGSWERIRDLIYEGRGR
ncbi:MAG: DUF2191 domain-containing protein [Gemmatimonadetes bacterium]|nr:DUF2191 domain-containing protein [Gemmatimonadota bacterium]